MSTAAAAGTDFYDALETREPAERERQLMTLLPAQVAHAQTNAPAWADLLRGVDAAGIDSRAALAGLPVLRKHELVARQQAARGACDTADTADTRRVFGGFSAIGWGAQRGVRRVFASPGPIYEPEGQAVDYWRLARALHAAGFRAGDLVHNAFSYHFSPAGSIMETGAHALGCAVFPAGIGQTEQQVRAMADLRPAGYVGTPSFLKIILEKAAELGVALPSLKRALVSGEACPSDLVDWLAVRGVAALQCYASADLGLIAYETPSRQGLVLDEGVIVEIVRPGTGEPLPDGEVGEVVVTLLNPDYPLIRFGTGDLSAVLPGMCPSGRTHTRIHGWLGRADQAAKVRGLFVHPHQVAEVLRRHPELGRARLVLSGEAGRDRMELQAETGASSAELNERVVQSLREVTRLRGDVVWVMPGTLPNDGRVIVDERGVR